MSASSTSDAADVVPKFTQTECNPLHLPTWLTGAPYAALTNFRSELFRLR